MTPPAHGKWLSIWARKPDAALRLFCLPFAGAGASYFYPWSQALAGTSIELAAVQLPGRENRSGELPFSSLEALVTALAHAIAPHLDRPFALFGHSMGALVAFEVARAIRHRQLGHPRHLFASGAKPPSRIRHGDRLHDLADADFLREMTERFQGIPDEVSASPELLGIVLPALRADMTVVETYEYRAAPPLTCSVTAIGGDADPHVSPDDLADWRGVTTGAFESHTLGGDHFYLTGNRTALLSQIASQLVATHRTTHAEDCC